MPLHTFKCYDKECEHSEMDIIKVDEENPPCAKCGGKTYRTLGSFNFQLKGGGWYKDGYTKPRK